MREFLIIGGGAQSRLITEIVNLAFKYYTVVNAKHHTDISNEIKEGIVAIGDNHTRAEVVKYIMNLIPDFQFKWVHHPSVIVAENVRLGYGSMVMAKAFLNRDTDIGKHTIINTNVIVEHDNKIGDYCCLLPGAITAGYVEIGDYTQIGMGALIRDKVKIGSNCIIGMGSVVLKDIPDNSTVWGCPAKIIK